MTKSSGFGFSFSKRKTRIFGIAKNARKQLDCVAVKVQGVGTKMTKFGVFGFQHSTVSETSTLGPSVVPTCNTWFGGLQCCVLLGGGRV